jgi:alkylation response protein AidB-like acyl-CoA dehydrogenase
VNFDLDQDERALQAAIRDLCRGVFPMETVRALESSGGVSEETWQALEDAGVFSLRLPEPEGGAGLGMTAAVIVFEELGRALVPGPLVGTHVMRSHGVSGERVVLAGRHDLVIPYVESSNAVAVVEGDAIWLMSQDAIAGEPVAQPLDPLTPVSRVSSLPQGEKVIEGPVVSTIRIEETALTAALLVGIASAETDLAVAYAKDRYQFGRPIGSFQAIKHICADMLSRAEVARAAVYAAGVHLDGKGDGDTARAVTGSMLLAGEAAFANGKACVQVHGGMGFTWEIDAHLYLKRAAALVALSGGADEHAEAMAAAL